MGISHDTEFSLRKQAIKEFLQGNLTQKNIYEKLSKSRNWFRYWLKQFRAKGFKGLYSKPAGYPKGKPRKYSLNLINEIVNIRKRLEENSREYCYGAERIIQELADLGYDQNELPSIAYVKKVLSQTGCIRQTKYKNYTPLKGYPEAFLKSLGLLCQIDL